MKRVLINYQVIIHVKKTHTINDILNESAEIIQSNMVKPSIRAINGLAINTDDDLNNFKAGKLKAKFKTVTIDSDDLFDALCDAESNQDINSGGIYSLLKEALNLE